MVHAKPLRLRSTQARHNPPTPALIGRRSWDATGESSWCVLHKLLYLNHLKHADVVRVFLSHPREKLTALPIVERREMLRFDVAENVNTDLLLANTNLTAASLPLAFRAAYRGECAGRHGLPDLQYCPECLASGFHTELFQVFRAKTCPWHNVPLTTGCPTCGKPIHRRVTLSQPIEPFCCPNGHRLWPGIHRRDWAGGPTVTQRQALRSIVEYLGTAQRAFRRNGTAVMVTGWGLDAVGWEPLYHWVCEPPAALLRLIESDPVYPTTHVGPASRQPKSSERLRERLEAPSSENWGRPDLLAAEPAARLFIDHFLDDLLDESDAFFQRLSMHIDATHSHCSIGLHNEPYFDAWTVRPDAVCVWRAAYVLARALSPFSCRDYGNRALTKRALTHQKNFEFMYRYWAKMMWPFLDEGGSHAELPFGRWLLRCLVRHRLESGYLTAIEEVLANSDGRQTINSYLTSGWFVEPGALVDYAGDRPVVHVATQPRRFKGALSACALGKHEATDIAKFLEARDCEYDRQQ